MLYGKDNPRFILNIGSCQDRFPDVPEQGADVEIYDRQERKPVITIHRAYANAICLEMTTSPNAMPFTIMEDWFNGLDNASLESEGMEPTK